MVCAILAALLHFAPPGCPVRHYVPTPQPRHPKVTYFLGENDHVHGH